MAERAWRPQEIQEACPRRLAGERICFTKNTGYC